MNETVVLQRSVGEPCTLSLYCDNASSSPTFLVVGFVTLILMKKQLKLYMEPDGEMGHWSLEFKPSRLFDESCFEKLESFKGLSSVIVKLRFEKDQFQFFGRFRSVFARPSQFFMDIKDGEKIIAFDGYFHDDHSIKMVKR